MHAKCVKPSGDSVIERGNQAMRVMIRKKHFARTRGRARLDVFLIFWVSRTCRHASGILNNLGK